MNLCFRFSLLLSWILTVSSIIGCVQTPRLTVPDVETQSQMKVIAGKVEYVSGSVMGGQAKELHPLKTDSEVYLGWIFQVKEKSAAKILTTGNWWVVLEGEGEFSFDDAKTNSQKTKHLGVWSIQRGSLRIKPKDFDPGEHYFKIKTPLAEITLQKGEMGISLEKGGQGRGQIWLYRGNAEIVWKNGSSKKLQGQEMSYL